MIALTSIKKDTSHWDEIVSLYMTAFPSDERREINELINIQDIDNYFLLQITSGDKFIGFLEFWEFKDFIFLEHLAIISGEQQKGFGTKLLKNIPNNSIKPILLEAEPIVDFVSDKRIQFYRKAGFKILNFDYRQPPYYPGKKSVPLLLLSDRDLTYDQIESHIREIRDKVYKVYKIY